MYTVDALESQHQHPPLKTLGTFLEVPQRKSENFVFFTAKIFFFFWFSDQFFFHEFVYLF